MRNLIYGLLISICIITGCTGQLPQPDQTALNKITAVPSHDVDLGQNLQAMPAPVGQWQIDGGSLAAVSPNSNSAAFVGEDGRFYLLSILERSLKQIFQKFDYIPQHLSFVGNHHLAYVTQAGDHRVLQVSDLDGKVVWQKPIQGDFALYASDDGQRVLLFDRSKGKALLMDNQGVILAEHLVHLGAKAYFNGHNVLLQNGRQIIYYDSTGKVLFSYEIKTGPTAEYVVPDRAGSRIAITTRDGEQTLYLFNTEGKLLWNANLPEGKNRPVFSTDGQKLFVLNRGRKVELQTYEVPDARLLWRGIFVNGQKHATGEIRNLRYTHGILRLQYLDPSGTPYLIDLDEHGRALRSYQFRDEKLMFGTNGHVISLGLEGTVNLYRITEGK